MWHRHPLLIPFIAIILLAMQTVQVLAQDPRNSNASSHADGPVDFVLFTSRPTVASNDTAVNKIAKETIRRYASNGHSLLEATCAEAEAWVDQNQPQLRSALPLRKLIAFAQAKGAWVIGGIELADQSFETPTDEKISVVHGWVLNLRRGTRGDVWVNDMDKAIRDGLELMDSVDQDLDRRRLLSSRFALEREIPKKQLRVRKSRPLWSETTPFWGIWFSSKVVRSSSPLIGMVYPGSPAELAGLSPGDIIKRIDDKTPKDTAEVLRVCRALKPGSSLNVEYENDHGTRSINVRSTSESKYFRQRAKRFLNGIGSDHRVIEFPENRLENGCLDGKAMVCFFWATWCGPCKEPLLALQTYAGMESSKVKLLAISVDEDAKQWKKFITDNQLGFTHVLSPRWASEWGIESFPSVVIISRDRKSFRVCEVDDLPIYMAEFEDAVPEPTMKKGN